MNNFAKYLPIGTVCMLKKGSKKVMITGFCTTTKKDDTVYDYNACLFPEGILTTDKTIVFNHDQIDKVFYMGYMDDEARNFHKGLNVLIEKINSGEIKLNNEQINND